MSDKATASEIRDDFSHKHLAAKLAEVQLAVERVPKRGHNQHFNYDFATESDITAAIRKEMAQRGMMLVPDIVAVSYRETNTKSGIQTIARVDVKFTVMDGVTGESLTFGGTGEGADSGDKCVPKAITSALKYALLKLFLIPTGDDPEIDHKPKAPKGPVAVAVAKATAPEPSSDVPEGYSRIAKYELDQYGWHHVILAATGVEVKTKFAEKGDDLRYAFEHKVPVKVTYDKRSYVTKVEVLKGVGGEEPEFDEIPVPDDFDVPF